MIGNIPGNKSNIYERDWSKCDRENFILHYFSVDWEDLLKIDELNGDNSTKTFLDKINMLLDTYVPLKDPVRRTLYYKRNVTLTTKNIEILSTLMKKSKHKSKFIMT